MAALVVRVSAREVVRDEKTSFNHLHSDIGIPVHTIGWGNFHLLYHGRPRTLHAAASWEWNGGIGLVSSQEAAEGLKTTEEGHGYHPNIQ